MAFVRLKKIKGQNYAYLVENYWKEGRSKQRVTKYLGRTYKLEKQHEAEPVRLSEDFKEIVLQLVAWELEQHGFENANGNLVKDGIIIDLNKQTVSGGSRKVVLQMNEGFLCDHTLKQALAYKPVYNYAEKDAPKLAALLLGAGLSLPKEIFVEVYENSTTLLKREDVPEDGGT